MGNCKLGFAVYQPTRISENARWRGIHAYSRCDGVKMIIRLVKRHKPNITVRIKPYGLPIEAYNKYLLKIYQQGKEDYQHGKTNTN